jgi:glycosyltransferase involved in cell wall biosynthesis
MTTLGICIPTYRRPDFLRRCVLSALKAAGDRPIRIFIADDAMDETNSTLFDELQARSDCIVVHHNIRNLGIDDNIQQCVKMCDCDYAWIIGEDDYFLPDSVRRIHDLLQGIDVPFIFANYVFVGDGGDHVLGRPFNEPDGSLTGPEFVRHHLSAAGFIGACIVNRRGWDATSTAPYMGSYYTHVGRICELLAKSGAIVRIVSEPSVANRVEGTDTFTWKHDSYGVFFGFKAMCEAVAAQCPSIASQALHAAKVTEQSYLRLRLAMRLRAERSYDQAQYRRYLAPNIASPLKRLAFFLISVAPPATFRPLVALHRRLRLPTTG